MATWSSNIERYNPLQYTLLNWLICIPPILFTFLRLIVRWRQVRAFYWDDIFATFALACLIIIAALNQVERDSLYIIVDVSSKLTQAEGAGNIPPRQAPGGAGATAIGELISTVNKQQFVCMIFFWTCLWCVKGSLLMFYRRLFVRLDGYMKWWYIVVAFNIVAYFVSVLTNFLACLPFSRRFSASSFSTCSVDFAATVLQVATAVDLFTDFLIMALPIRLLFGLHISIKQKIGITSIFCLGTVVMLFSTIRMVSVVPLVRSSTPTVSISVALWSILEGAVAVVIASLPPLKSLISSRGDTGYGGTRSKAVTRSNNGKLGSLSQVGAKGHIRLYDMSSSKAESRVQTGYSYDSEEALNQTSMSEGKGIVRTQEVTVTNLPMSKASNDDRIDSCRHV